MINGRGKRGLRKGCASEIHGRGASYSRSVHVFFHHVFLLHTTASRLSHVMWSSLVGEPMPLCSIALPEPSVCCWRFSLRFFLPRLFSQLRPHTQLSVREGGLLSAFARRDHCWSHFPYFGEKVGYASFFFYVFPVSRRAVSGMGMCKNRWLNQSQTFEIGSAAQKRAAGVAPITSIIR